MSLGHSIAVSLGWRVLRVRRGARHETGRFMAGVNWFRVVFERWVWLSDAMRALGYDHDWLRRETPNKALERTATAWGVVECDLRQTTAVAGASALPVAVAQLGR